MLLAPRISEETNPNIIQKIEEVGVYEPRQIMVNDNKQFINRVWRPMMAYVYMVTCVVDFILFPILWSILQAYSGGVVTTQWMPLTLQGAGLYHVAFGAILGIAAWGRTKEKLSDRS